MGLFELGGAADIARYQVLDLVAVLALHDHQVTETLGLLLGAVPGGGVRGQITRHDAEE